jgi:hypothetical protein
MDDPVAVTLKRASGLTFRFWIEAATAVCREARVNLERRTLNRRRFEGANMIHSGNLADTMRVGNADRPAAASDTRAIDSEIR